MTIKNFSSFLRDAPLTYISEAINTRNFEKVGNLIKFYLSKKLHKNFLKLDDVEEFKNENGHQYGIRYFYPPNKSVRFNWKQLSLDSRELDSVDLWLGHGQNRDLHISFEGQQSLIKILPIVVDVIREPKPGYYIFSNDDQDHLISESVEMINEDQFYDQAATHCVPGNIIDNGAMTPMAANIMRSFKAKYEKYFTKVGRSYKYIGPADFFIKNKDEVMQAIGRTKVRVTKVSTKDIYVDSPQVTAIEQNKNRIAYQKQLEHLEGLVNMVLGGVANALFVSGRGGTGKTQTVEDTLAAAGKTDGNGYFKQTGSTSAIGLYLSLYSNKGKDDLVLFDDCDGALKDQDGRNIIKAATDTKPIRKLAWGKQSPSVVPADNYDPATAEPGKVPSYYEFEGKVIFISNLTIDKLDPDGALRTRALMIEIDPTDIELTDFMKLIAPTIDLGTHSLSVDERLEVVQFITDNMKGRVSLRTLVRALKIRAIPGIGENWKEYTVNYS